MTLYLSYPYVFAWGDDYYMIPRAGRPVPVRLYRATHFPTAWSYVQNLVQRSYIVDSSVFYYGARWWMFAETGDNFRFDTLCSLQPRPDRPWVEHPNSPIVSVDPHIARPAGAYWSRAIESSVLPGLRAEVWSAGLCLEVEELTPTFIRSTLWFLVPSLGYRRRME